MTTSDINNFSRELEALQSRYGIIALQLLGFFRDDINGNLRNFALAYNPDNETDDHIGMLNRAAFDAASAVIQGAPGAYVVSEGSKLRGSGNFIDPDKN